MKKLIKIGIGLFSIGAIFTACSDVDTPSSSKTGEYIVSGRVVSDFSVAGTSARTAVASNSAVEYTITATNAETKTTKEVECSFGSFSVGLKGEGIWTFTAEYTTPNGGATLSGSVDVVIDNGQESIEEEILIPVTPTILNSDGTGSIYLFMNDATGKVNEATATCEDEGTITSLDVSSSFGYNTITYNKADVKSGNYLTTFRFYDANEKLIYSFTENVIVIPELVTSSWRRNGTNDNFTISNDLLKLYAKKSPIAVWNNATTENYYNGAGEVAENTDLIQGLQLCTSTSSLTVSESSVLEGTASDSGITDFCFDDDCNLYVLSGETIYKYAYGFAGYTKATGSVNLYNYLASINIGDATVYGIQYANGTLFVLLNSKYPNAGVDDTNTYNYISPIQTNFLETIPSDYTLPLVKIEEITGTTMHDFVVDGSNIYIAYTNAEYGTTTIAKASYTITDGELTYEVSSDSADITPSALGLTDVSSSSYYINDMQVVSDALYVLVSTWTNGSSTGGVVKIPFDTFAVEDWSTDNVETWGLSISKVRGWYVSEGNYSYCFYTPRKFIAKRPDELWIADDGIYTDVQSNVKNKNRVVQIDLQEQSFVVYDTTRVMFSAQVASGNLKLGE